MSVRVRAEGVLALVALVTAACTPRVEPAGDFVVPSASPTVAPAPTEPARDRLLVLRSDGSLATMSRDGSDVVPLTGAASAGSFVQQATWSPDGYHVAWVEIDPSSIPPTTRIVTSGHDGTGRTTASVDVPAFYLSWDPTSTRIAYLGAIGNGIQMGVVEPGAGATPLASGRPFYLSWAPAGDRLAVHVGSEVLSELTLGGATEPLGPVPGIFQAPVWTANGTIVAAVEGPRGQRLVALAPGTAASPIADLAGLVAFVVSPDGRRVAYQTLGRDAGSFLEPNPDSRNPGGVYVARLEGGSVEEVTRERALAFFWSPAGDRLLYLTIEPRPLPSEYRWRVWDGGELFTGAPFSADLSFLTAYMPFFDQYAQSMTHWAPDGSAFAYPGATLDGERSGVWVQEVRDGAEPVLVSDGSFVAWSPT
jgi:hypothetical protein